MIRLEGATAVVRGLFPPEYVDLYGLVTALGDPAVATLVLALSYWLWRREAAATVVGYAFVAFALTLLLKYGLALPRPATADQLLHPEGYGFPSGHAISATVVYGGLAVEVGWHRDRLRALGVSVLVAAVGLSRVALGVHYLGDVLVGFAVGGFVVWTGHTYWRDRPEVGFALAGLVAVPAIFVSGMHADAMGVLGYALGGIVGARAIGTSLAASRIEAGVLGAVGVAFVVGMQALTDVADATLVTGALADAILVAGVLLLPALFARVWDDERAQPAVFGQ
ncbi:phosphatase PAP2 family protein [Haloarchaeobius sp. DFWS5]|uniref:phosphatase PAP2 family protein n=1 Tax=Haloarchaeobius sp. DFWS5 TaxID=3446114 RepID=UPI003EBD62DA